MVQYVDDAQVRVEDCPITHTGGQPYTERPVEHHDTHRRLLAGGATSIACITAPNSMNDQEGTKQDRQSGRARQRHHPGCGWSEGQARLLINL